MSFVAPNGTKYTTKIKQIFKSCGQGNVKIGYGTFKYALPKTKTHIINGFEQFDLQYNILWWFYRCDL